MCADGNTQEFDKYALNHDGVLDADEMALQGVPVSDVRRLDATSDSVVDEDELRRAADHAVLGACHNELPDKPDSQPMHSASDAKTRGWFRSEQPVRLISPDGSKLTIDRSADGAELPVSNSGVVEPGGLFREPRSVSPCGSPAEWFSGQWSFDYSNASDAGSDYSSVAGAFADVELSPRPSHLSLLPHLPTQRPSLRPHKPIPAQHPESLVSALVSQALDSHTSQQKSEFTGRSEQSLGGHDLQPRVHSRRNSSSNRFDTGPTPGLDSVMASVAINQLKRILGRFSQKEARKLLQFWKCASDSSRTKVPSLALRCMLFSFHSRLVLQSRRPE